MSIVTAGSRRNRERRPLASPPGMPTPPGRAASPHPTACASGWDTRDFPLASHRSGSLRRIPADPLRHNIEARFSEKQGRLVPADHVLHGRVVGDRRDELHRQPFRIVDQDVERVRGLRDAVREFEFTAARNPAVVVPIPPPAKEPVGLEGPLLGRPQKRRASRRGRSDWPRSPSYSSASSRSARAPRCPASRRR
jgi:hypothetical protein